MWGALAIIYVVVAAIVFVGMMIFLIHAWKETSYEEQMMALEYPEDAGSGILAICIFFIVSLLMGLMWPLCPVILIGVVLYDKIQEKWPKICGVKEEEDEPGTDS